MVGIAHVHGRSMEPTLHEGDRVVVLYGLRPVIGRMAVVRLPDSASGPRPLAIKRVTGRTPGAPADSAATGGPSDPAEWWVERDSPTEGVDSWLVGPLSRQQVLGVVVGRLPSRPRPPRWWPRRRG